DIDGLSDLVDENTTLIFCESIGNPLGNICDIELLAKAAHSKGVPLVVDNTVATPYLLKPIDYGADIVIHSLTKYISGHGTTIGGAIVDAGNFDWSKEPKRFPTLNEPDNSYHGLIYSEALGAAAFIGRCRVGPLRNTGAALSPFNAFLILQGIQSLHVRMDRHCENTINVAQYLSTHSQVKWVNYGGLDDSPYFDLAKKYTNGLPSGILTFGIEGGKEAGIKFIDSLKLIVRLVNIGDTKSLATHPASTTHSQLEHDEYEAAGISEDMVRISIGIENVDDIISDIEQALNESK
ncbi:MAG: aminotransferase class V-fold PLP-dependent enzyme, partial [Gammaproteobacteria bacterium]|nr:aminotransferase class V-fold PLP-dependent enzyme [Gammaproteobacteria bacterium]